MASSGRSFKAIELNSAGTSRAWTTFPWFSLQKKARQTCCLTGKQQNKGWNVFAWNYQYMQMITAHFFMIWISLLQRSLFLEFSSRRQSFTAIFSPDSWTEHRRGVKQITNTSGSWFQRRTDGWQNLQGAGTGRRAQSLPSQVFPSSPKSHTAGSV